MKPENIAGKAEVVAECRFPQRNYVERFPDFPEPVAWINGGRTAVWNLEEVRAWKNARTESKT